MANVGMDVEQVTAVQNALKSLSTEIQQVVASVESAVNQSHAAWFGADSDMFVQWWTTDHRPGLTKAGEAIAHLADIARTNADAQTQASSSSGTSGGTSVGGSSAGGTAGGSASAGTNGGTSSGGAPASSASDGGNAAAATAPGNTAIADKTAAFAATWDGKYLDFDGAYGNQCYDLFSAYNHDVVGGPGIHAATTGGAKDIYNDYATNGAAGVYDRIPAGAAPPQVGDVVVWGGGTYGHVGVVTAVTDGGFTSIEQNIDGNASDGSTGALPTEVNHGFDNGLLGFLRPKG